MKIQLKITLIILFAFLNAKAFATITWSKEAHERLIVQAFGVERQDCIAQMKNGSAWADSLANQVPSKSYMHAMRSGAEQPIAEAADLMANFIQRNYEQAIDLKTAGIESSNSTSNDPLAQYTTDHNLILNMDDYLNYCYQRGVALHPVMDSTSPAHADFAIWSLTDLSGILKHGNFPESIEDETALIANPDLMVKTTGLMRLVDKIYLDFEMRDFKFTLK